MELLVLVIAAAFVSGLLLRRAALVLAIVGVVVARYVAAVAQWGLGGPNDQPALQYAGMVAVWIGAVAACAAGLGALVAFAARASRAPS